MYNPEKLTRRGNKHAIHACVTQFSRLFTIFFSLLFVFPPCKFSSPYAPVYTRIIYIYLKCSSHGPAAIFTPAAPPLFTYLLTWIMENFLATNLQDFCQQESFFIYRQIGDGIDRIFQTLVFLLQRTFPAVS